MLLETIRDLFQGNKVGSTTYLLGEHVFVLRGSMSCQEREENIAAFKRAGGSAVFLLTKSAGTIGKQTHTGA